MHSLNVNERHVTNFHQGEWPGTGGFNLRDAKLG